MQPLSSTGQPFGAFCTECKIITQPVIEDNSANEGDELTIINRYVSCAKCHKAIAFTNGLYKVHDRRLYLLRHFTEAETKAEMTAQFTAMMDNGVEAPEMTCPRCNYTFKSGVRIGARSMNLEPGFTWEYPCPKCYKPVYHVEDAGFSFDRDGLVTLLSSSEVTPQLLTQLKNLVEETQANPEKITEFKEQANAIIPTLGDRVEKYIGERKNTIEFLKFLLAIIGTLLAGLAYLKGKPALVPPTIIHNTYNSPVLAPSVKQSQELRRIQARPAPTRGSNLTPPKKPKKRRKS